MARRRERLEALAKEAAEHGGRIESFSADLGTEQGLAAVLRRVNELGEIDLLINNAGVAIAGDFVGASLDREIGEIRPSCSPLGSPFQRKEGGSRILYAMEDCLYRFILTGGTRGLQVFRTRSSIE